MDRTDREILDLLKGNARMSWQALGEALGMTRVGARKRVQKLEEEGVIRGYNTYILLEDEVTMLIDIVTLPERLDAVLAYVAGQTMYIRQIFRTGEDRLHLVAVSDQASDLGYLVKMIRRRCGKDIKTLEFHTVNEVIKDVYGGIRYEGRSASERHGDHERDQGRESS